MEASELWRRLSPRLKTSVDNGLPVDFVANFCKVSNDTVSRWLRDRNKPAGDAMLRLLYLLREIGVDSPEVEEFSPFVRALGRLFAFDVISARQAQEISGQNSPNVSQVYVTMRGSDAMHPSFTTNELSELYNDELNARRKTALKGFLDGKVAEDVVPAEAQVPEPAAEVPTPIATSVVIGRKISIEYGQNVDVTLASLLSAAAPLARSLNDDGSASRRSEFRDLIGAENLFELSNTLNALCSERARGMAR